MDLNTFIVAVFCLIDDRTEDRALRARGPLPKLSDAEVLTIEIVGEFLGLDTDEAIFRYFRRHYGEWFPTIGEVHRTTFARNFSVSLLTIRPSPSATRCPCRLVCSPAPTGVLASREKRPLARTRSSDKPSTVSGCT